MLTRDSQLFTAFPHSRGFSLVELMVALVITLILLAGVAQIFLSSKKSYAIQNTLGRQQETGRYAFDVLATDLRRAGFWGSSLAISSGSVVPAHTDCLSGDSEWGRVTDLPIYGLNSTEDIISDYLCIPDPGSTNGYFGQGDVLVVRYADPEIIGGTDNTAFVATRFYLRSNPLDAYDGLIDTGNNLGTPSVNAPASELHAYAYYIGDSGQQCNGANVPSLFRVGLSNTGTPTEIEEVAYGVDQLQVQYGLDTLDPSTDPPDNSVAAYRNAGHGDLNESAEWDQVIAARFWLLTRAECPETGYTNTNTYNIGDLAYTPGDAYRRQLYQTTVSLRNR